MIEGGMEMKTWAEFKHENPELAMIGRRMFFQSRPQVGYAFIATLRQDGAPRLHPVSVVLFDDRLFILIPPTSPKCADLLRDGRFAMQAIPPPNNEAGEEFYLSGQAATIPDSSVRQALITGLEIRVEPEEVLFELLFDRAMYTRLENQGSPLEHPVHQKWPPPG
jgi:hypothetical protein